MTHANTDSRTHMLTSCRRTNANTGTKKITPAYKDCKTHMLKRTPTMCINVSGEQQKSVLMSTALTVDMH